MASGDDGEREDPAEHADVRQPAEEMRLLVAGELGEEIVEPDEAEAQAVGREPHAAQREDDGIEGREDREDQDQDHGRRDEEGARVAVHPFAPASGPEKSSRGIPRLVCRCSGSHRRELTVRAPGPGP